MEELIPRTLRRWETYQSSLYKSAVLAKFQSMTRGHLTLKVHGDPHSYSFGFGKKVQAEMEIRNERFFMRFMKHGELGFGESFVDGDWDSPNLVALIRWFLLNIDQLDALGRFDSGDHPLFQFLQSVQQIQSMLDRTSAPLGFSDSLSAHYDLERSFFALMLDATLTNSSAIFEGQETIDAAQLRKHRRIAQELRIRPGDHILELGAGWGSLSLYLALCFPCKITAVTISEEQHRYLQQKVAEMGLGQRVFPSLLDYRSVKGSFDRIVSIELIDALDAQELPGFFAHCDELLKPQGIMVHQLLLTPERFRSENHAGADWIRKYISPGSFTPSLSQFLHAASEKADFCVRRLEDIGLSYARTLGAWRQRFESHLTEVKALGFDESFIRSWRYYLSYAEAAFQHGLLTAAQLTMTRPTQRGEEAEQKPFPADANAAMLVD